MTGSQAQAMLGCMRSVKHLWTDLNPGNVKIYTYQHEIVYNHNFNLLQNTSQHWRRKLNFDLVLKGADTYL